MLSQIFKQIDIKNKLYLISYLLVASALVISSILVIIYQFYSVKSELQNDLNAQLSVIEGNIGSAVTFRDAVAAKEILHSLSLNSSIDSAYVLLDDGALFADYQFGASKPESEQLNFFQILDFSDLHLSRNIVVNDAIIGQIHINANLNKAINRIMIFVGVLMSLILIALLFSRVLVAKLGSYITQPISYLEQLVSEITKNKNYTLRSEWSSNDEIGRLSLGINSMLESIKERDDMLLLELEYREQVERKLDFLAYFDNQTGLRNRHAFNEHIQALTELCKATKKPFYLLIIDLDFFKIVNDTYGHDIGDALLTKCAKRLIQSLSDQDQIYRIGGDEFAVLLSDVETILDVEKICHRINQAIGKPFKIHKNPIHIGASIGVSQYLDENLSISNLIKHADNAMYWAKAAGKNTFKIYSEEIEQENYFRQKLSDDLQHAIVNNQLELVYQPIMDVSIGQVVGFESLLRWRHPEHGVISPNMFIPLAESSGAIVPIGEWVIHTAVEQIKEWQQLFNPHLFVNINLSGKQFADKQLTQTIWKILECSQLETGSVRFELTESVLLDDVQRAVNVLTELRMMGVGVAIDDFGTGQSSMNYLKLFPLDTIKIDRAFVKGLPIDSVDKAIIQAIFALAKSLSLDIVVEGVETQEQLDFLKEIGGQKMQGYLFSHPLTKTDMTDMLLSHQKLLETVINH